MNFIIFTPQNCIDFFVLPDFCSITAREEINIYLNPDIREISVIGFPLSSKIYIEIYSEKSIHCPKVSGILKINSEQVGRINNTSLSLANKIIACENKDYLEKLVNKTSA